MKMTSLQRLRLCIEVGAAVGIITLTGLVLHLRTVFLPREEFEREIARRHVEILGRISEVDERQKRDAAQIQNTLMKLLESHWELRGAMEGYRRNPRE
jgi:hypothetical protein